ncbi:MAG: AAA family ATPase [Cytophagales bacterium]|jgi:AAA15 family ATPase/GTPase|nr:AAA family ATPase [Cytophagales bacterium]MCA6387045.1 AAA family ATPase [Cytophagales bacterium]MCA6392017.1 AAA family ATPase [Cytophagales bacterium]MCA6399460.1 AAA family ATPase [Cytophagales bacterium]MCA6402214.1 AAA family ATPase [Cytophagales bacterium]
MHLKKIEIEGFRGIAKTALGDFGQINVLVGKNNCGKTSVLESIFLLCGMTNPELILRISSQRDLILNEEDDFRFIYNNLDYNKNLEIKGDFDTNNQHRELNIRPKKSILKNIKPSNSSVFDSNSISENIYELDLISSLKETHKPKISFESKLIYSQGAFSIEPAKNYSDKLRATLLPPRWTTAVNLEKKLEELVITKQLSSIINVLKKVDAAIQGISLGSNRMIYVDIGLSRLIPINLLGDGMKRLLSILLTMPDAKDGIVLIDEIDNGLHFSAQSTMWKAIIEGCKFYNVQLFCTTHNYETLKNLSEVVEDDNPDFKKLIRSYTIRKVGSETLSYEYDFEKLDFSIQQGIEFR